MAEVKRVVSISLGSGTNNAAAEVELFDQRFVVERIGTDGSLARAAQLFRELDGKVAAFGLGGTDLHIVAGKRRYSFREIRKLVSHARITPVVDGSGLKHTLEREAIRQLEPLIGWKGRKVLVVSALDRFGMAEALDQVGADVIYGDAIFGVGVNYPIRRIAQIERLAGLILPVVTQLPFRWFYPTGKKQDATVRDWRQRYYHWADVVAGDYHYIDRFRPERLDGKTIITQTIRPKDVEALRKAGVARLIATTPRLNGNNFGTNLMEALLVAVSGKNRPLTPAEYSEYIHRLGFKPDVYALQSGAEAGGPGSNGRHLVERGGM